MKKQEMSSPDAPKGRETLPPGFLIFLFFFITVKYTVYRFSHFRVYGLAASVVPGCAALTPRRPPHPGSRHLSPLPQPWRPPFALCVYGPASSRPFI